MNIQNTTHESIETAHRCEYCDGVLFEVFALKEDHSVVSKGFFCDKECTPLTSSLYKDKQTPSTLVPVDVISTLWKNKWNKNRKISHQL
jgi:hypothetical protein